MAKTTDQPLALLLASLTALGDPAAELAADELRDLATDADGWEALALNVAAQAVIDHGPDGIKLASTQLIELVEGRRTELDVADARTSHAILVAMEQGEKVRRRDIRNWFTKLGVVLGSLGAVFMSGVVSGALKGASGG